MNKEGGGDFIFKFPRKGEVKIKRDIFVGQ
jgi:hypothetical protein